jgi:hypothetical protein
VTNTSRSRFFSYFGKEGLAGGLNVADSPLIISPSEMTKAENISIAQTLARRKRPGQEAYHTGSYAGTLSYPVIGPGNPIRGNVQYWRSLSGTGQNVEDVFLHQGTKVWSIENRTSPAIDRTGALSLSLTGIPQYQVFEGQLYFTSSNPADGYNKWNGLDIAPGPAQAATPPPDGPGKYLSTYGGRMLMGGNPDFPYTVYVSAAYDAEDWTSNDTTSFQLDYDGDPEGITAIFPAYQGEVYIATRRSIYRLSCTDPGDINTYFLQKITKGIGCVSARTVVATPNDILWMSDRGVHSLKKLVVSDQTDIQFLSRDIQPIFTRQLANTLLEQAEATWDENENLYILTVPSSGQTTNDVILAYNLNYGYWTTWTGINARSISNVLIQNKQYPMVGKENGKLNILRDDIMTDEGQGFAASFKTGKIFPGGDITKQWHFVSITILASATTTTNVQLNWYVDGVNQTVSSGDAFSLGQGSDLLGSTFILGQSRLGIGRFLPRRVTVGETGYNIQLEVVASGTSDIEFYGFILEVDDGDPQFV